MPKEKLQELIDDNRIWFGVDGNNVPRLKRFLSEVQEGVVPTTIWLHQDVGHNQEGRQEIKELFDDKGYFDGPKPVRLLKRIFQISTTTPSMASSEFSSEPYIILDFFAGSATTAHAVLDQNKQDNGHRRFIMVQLPEPCTPDSDAFRAGYKTIADIGKERIRRVIKKITTESNPQMTPKAADKNQRELFESPPPESAQPADISSLDLGFKVLKLNKSSFKQWRKLDPSTPPETIEKQLELHIDHIDPGATPEDLLYEILLKAGYTPTEKIEMKIFAGKNVFSVADGELLLCLEDKVTKELIEAVIAANPRQFICLDAAFYGNDQLKANAVQAFKAHHMAQENLDPVAGEMEKEKHNQIVFRTV